MAQNLKKLAVEQAIKFAETRQLNPDDLEKVYKAIHSFLNGEAQPTEKYPPHIR